MRTLHEYLGGANRDSHRHIADSSCQCSPTVKLFSYKTYYPRQSESEEWIIKEKEWIRLVQHKNLAMPKRRPPGTEGEVSVPSYVHIFECTDCFERAEKRWNSGGFPHFGFPDVSFNRRK